MQRYASRGGKHLFGSYSPELARGYVSGKQIQYDASPVRLIVLFAREYDVAGNTAIEPCQQGLCKWVLANILDAADIFLQAVQSLL